MRQQINSVLTMLLGLCAGPALERVAHGQAAHITTPFNTASSGFYEQMGVNFGVQTGNFFFQQNSFGQALPPFGGFTPGAGATLGFSTPIPGGSASFNLSAGQGSQSTLSSQSVSGTMMNGVTGGFFDVSQTPFVTGVVPVVGQAGQDNPVAERWQRLQQERPQPRSAPVQQRAAQLDVQPDNGAAAAPARHNFDAKLAAAQRSTAGQAALSVAELRQLRAKQEQVQQAARAQQIATIVDRAQQAETAGKLSVARLYYQQAARQATGAEREDLNRRAAELADARTPSKPRAVSQAGHDKR